MEVSESWNVKPVITMPKINGADDGIPENYVLQVRHYMAVMNIKKAYIACLYGNNENEFVYRFLERDEIGRTGTD